MKITNNDTLSLWREETSRHIQQHFEVFRNLVTQAKDFAQQGKYDAAAVYADVAAAYAFRRHCGLFVSQELEQVLLTIGKKAIQKNHYLSKNFLFSNQPKKILHIATSVKGIGGHSRMIWRWIVQDGSSSHSVVLTRQSLASVPQMLKDAVLKSHGNIHTLSNICGFVSAAKRLREIAASADIVVLHISPDDTIPVIAFANKQQSPPIVFLDHADHGFWVGASISDVVANMRSSGMLLSKERRSIEAERIGLLPILLPSIHRKISRTQAKQKLGFDSGSIVLLSIARAAKYKTIDGVNFAQAHVPLLEKYKNAVLVVIGLNNNEDWSAEVERTQGRIKMFLEREDTEVFYQAADIYVDSFPYVSITSLLEAGSYGVPLVSRYPYSDVSAVYGADAPGLDNNLVRTPNLEEYTAILSRLVEDEEFRLSLGEATQSKIAQTHTSTNWQKYVEKLYLRAATIPPVNLTLVPDKILITELDVLLMRLFFLTFSQQEVQLEQMIKVRAISMPYIQKLHIWRNLRKNYHFSWNERASFLLPIWLYRFLEKTSRVCFRLSK